MPNILTPVSLWGNFDKSLETEAETVSSETSDGVVLERVTFKGRDTGAGRVVISALYAYDEKSPSPATVIIFPDSSDTVDENLSRFFVGKGFTVLMVDYRGEWENCQFFTCYPENVYYANRARCERRMEFFDDTAVETSWYEWVAVGIYARKYAFERSQSDQIAVMGIRDGGEIAWKLGYAEEFGCIIPVCAAGWRAYAGVNKYMPDEPELNEERYRFIGGIDSQAYAPYVKCPVLMLCSTNDVRFDYDRAYDTFSRINPEFVGDSAIAYSVHCNESIGVKCVDDMFMFLDRNLKNRQVFIPKPAEVTVETDEDENLVARALFDDQGVVEACGMYLAEECVESSMREWVKCTPKSKISPKEQVFYLDLYENTSTIFVISYAKYINGFTVWSRTSVKKISGKFRNMQSKSKVLYSDKYGNAAFSVNDYKKCSIGGIFLIDDSAFPSVTETAKGVKGLYSKYGLTTYRMNNPRYTPAQGNLLKFDINCEENCRLKISLTDMISGEVYSYVSDAVGGVWLNFVLESNLFKTSGGTALAAYGAHFKLTFDGESPFSINNVMWL